MKPQQPHEALYGITDVLSLGETAEDYAIASWL